MTHKYPSDLSERAFRFACDIVTFTRELSTEPGVVRNIAWQLADAGTSIAANYEEAKAAYSRREFAVKNCISLKEARESRLWRRVAITCHLAVDNLEAARLLQESEELVAIFTTIVRKARVTQVVTASIVAALIASGLLTFSF
jgi:four helix bundle protein